MSAPTGVPAIKEEEQPEDMNFQALDFDRESGELRSNRECAENWKSLQDVWPESNPAENTNTRQPKACKLQTIIPTPPQDLSSFSKLPMELILRIF